jgi:hypothetical protein
MLLVNDFGGFWKAFGPKDPWLRRWKENGFRKKPAHNRKMWMKLSEVVETRNIEIDASHSQEMDENELHELERLKIMAQEETRPTAPGDVPREALLRDDTDHLLRRALERDK